MGKKGKKGQAGKPKKLTPKDVSKRLSALAKNLEEELKGADLFAPLPPMEDCAICLVPLPRLNSEIFYKTCCGKDICNACSLEHEASVNKQNEEKSAGKKLALTCPFCRELIPTDGPESLRQLQARCLKNDHNAFTMMGLIYQDGDAGMVKDDLKALDYFIRSVELGSPDACINIAICCNEGDRVAVHKERAALFQRVGALRGDVVARYNIGLAEYFYLGNHEIGIRHWKIAAEAGEQRSLNALRKIYNGNKPGKEFISKEYLESTYRACHDAQMEVKSEEREKHRSEE